MKSERNARSVRAVFAATSSQIEIVIHTAVVVLIAKQYDSWIGHAQS